ncbi:4Fe-4S binding protein [Methanopyrus kandleri]
MLCGICAFVCPYDAITCSSTVNR